jgi:transketolase
MLTAQELENLTETAKQIRIDIIKMVTEAGSGHTGGPLGMADILTALYFNVLNIDPQNPELKDRDRLVLSNGHICPVLYATLAERGFFPKEELMTLRKLGSRLQGHPHREALPGLETTSGPLGSGLSQASGMALVGKMDQRDWRVYCLTSDGEHDEGNTWEAIMFASKYKLDNLVCIVDRNNIQIDGKTDQIMPLGDLGKKYEQFGWGVIDINGHNFEEILGAFEKAKEIKGKPTVIIAHTTPGKGVSFMEDRFEWHGTPPDLQEVDGAPKKGDQAKKALEELEND